MKIINPDPDRWMTLSEAFNAIGQREYGDAWDKSEVQQADWEIDDGPTRQDYIYLGFSFGKSGIKLSAAERDALTKRQDRAEKTKEELRRLLFKGPIECVLLAQTGDFFRGMPGTLLTCLLSIETGWAGLPGATGEIRATGLMLIDRAQFMKAVAPVGAKGLRQLLRAHVKNGERLRKRKFLEIAKNYGVAEAAAERMRKEEVPEAWRKGGRPLTRTE